MDAELYKLIDQLSEAEKRTLREMLDRELAQTPPSNGTDGRAREFGWAQGQITIASDFDEPLEDFKEYME